MKALLILLLLTTTAAAQGSAPGQSPILDRQQVHQFITPPVPVPTHEESYGLTVLLVDLASVALMVQGSKGEVGFGGYMLGAPIIHMTQGNYGTAAVSMGARLMVPLTVGMLALGRCEETDPGSFSCLDDFGKGLLFGAGATMLFDWLYLSSHEVPDTTPQSGWASLRPSLSITSRQTQAGIALSF